METILFSFFLKFLKDISPFCGTTDISKPEWAALFAFGRGIHVTRSLRFNSGVTPADELAAEPFSFTYLLTGIGGAQNLTVRDQANTLMTEPCRLGLKED